VSLLGLAKRLGELAAFVVRGTSNTTAHQGIVALVETLTDGLLEDALDAFESAVAAVEGGIVVRAQQRAFAALVMRAVGEVTPLSDGEAEKAGARLLKQAAKVRSSVAKAASSGEHKRIDVLRCALYPAPGAPPLPWEPSVPRIPAPTPAPAPVPASAPEPPPPIEKQLGRIKFPLQWKRALGDDGCARVEEVFDDDDDDVLSVFINEDGELEASGLRLVVSSLVDELRAQGDAAGERDRATAERDRATAERDRAIAERDRAIAERGRLMAQRDSALQEAEEAADDAEQWEDHAGKLQAQLDGRAIGACRLCHGQ
jgi:hypothetical protein